MRSDETKKRQRTERMCSKKMKEYANVVCSVRYSKMNTKHGMCFIQQYTKSTRAAYPKKGQERCVGPWWTRSRLISKDDRTLRWCRRRETQTPLKFEIANSPLMSAVERSLNYTFRAGNGHKLYLQRSLEAVRSLAYYLGYVCKLKVLVSLEC